MRRSIPNKIGDLLGDYIRVSGFEEKLNETEVIRFWEELMKPAFSRYCRNVNILNGILYAEITSSVVKSELLMMREEIRKKLNDHVGTEIVRKIVFR
jgi:hypothetical protein